jgi:hypothetical protein
MPVRRTTSGVVEGVVQAEVYRNALDCRAFAPGQCSLPSPAAGAEVSVVESEVADMRTATDALGKYRFELPPGTVRLKFSLSGYDDQLSSTYTVEQNGLVTVPTVLLRMSAWAVSGVANDSGGRPVAGAGITIGDTGGVAVGNATTDASGSYRFASTSIGYGIPHPTQITVSVQKSGYETSYSPIVKCCNVGADTVINVQIGARALSVTLLAPTSMRVGDSAEVRGRIVGDDGADFTTPAGGLTSTDPSVLKPQLASLPTGAGVIITALKAGTATLSWTYNGIVTRSGIVVTN